MLKIKESVDLKELEKYGYKPKYDIDTGKLERYQWRSCTDYDIYINSRAIGHGVYCTGYDRLSHYDYVFVNTVLFNMIQDGIVEHDETC